MLKKGMRRSAVGAAALAACMLLAPAAHAAPPTDAPSLQLDLGSHAAPVRRIAVDENKGIVVTAADDKTAKLWDLASGELRKTLRPPIGAGVIGRLYGAAIHPTRPWVALGGTTSVEASGHAIYLFDTDSGRLSRRFDARAGDVKRLLWSPDGALLIAAYHGKHGIVAFDEEGRSVFEERFAGSTYGLAFSNDGLLAATSMDGKLRLYRVAGRSIAPAGVIDTAEREQFSVAFAPDGKQLVVGYTTAVGADIYNVASRSRVRRITPPGLDRGEDVRSAAWSRDGRFILLGGRDALGARSTSGTPSFVLSRYAVAEDRVVGSVTVARDTLLDLVAVADGRTLFAALDGTWGTVGADNSLRAARPLIPDLRGAAHLSISADARRVGWRFAFGAQPGSFDFDSRVVELSEPKSVAAPITRAGLFSSPSDWEDRYTPSVNGARIALEPGEISRAVTLVHATGDAFLGTSQALYRISPEGRVVWRTRTQTEVRAVNASVDARIVVTALSDGTLRWWRAADGTELLALFATVDRRWVVWTPNGYFDAGPGADTLAGWHVNRGASSEGDFFTFGRFRERLHKPQLIDLVFETLDVEVALAAQQRALEQAPRDALVAPAVPMPIAAAPAAKAAPLPPVPLAPAQLPPALAAVGPTTLQPAAATVDLPFAVRAQAPRAELAIEVRIDGRPATAQAVQWPAAFDGGGRGSVRIGTPEAPAVVQLLARDRVGYSEPLNFRIEPAPSVAAAAPATQPPAPALPSATTAVAPPAAAKNAPQSAAAVEAAARTRALPRLLVLAVGISDYRNRELSLGLPAKDARDFAAAMARQKGSLYRDVRTRVLINGDATRAAVSDALRWLVKSAQPDDVAMLFLAGHGVNTAAGTYYFVPYDGAVDRLEATAVPESEVRDALRAIQGRTLFFVDTCYAGNVVGSLKSASRELARLANSLASAENGVVVFASSTGRQNSEESDDWGNGAFTKALVEGLAGKADLTRRGQVTFKALDFFVSEEVRRLTNGRQTPVTIIPVGVPDFPVALTPV
jgi:WD40 repeat protein